VEGLVVVASHYLVHVFNEEQAEHAFLVCVTRTFYADLALRAVRLRRLDKTRREVVVGREQLCLDSEEHFDWVEDVFKAFKVNAQHICRRYLV